MALNTFVTPDTKRGCDELTRNMRMEGFPALSIHGDKEQRERDWVLNEFRSGRNPILVATDVAARGLDVKDVKAVINFDMPTKIEDYKHRIGRTGRAGATGVAMTLLSNSAADENMYFELKEYLKACEQEVPVALALHEASRFKPGTISEGKL